MRLTVVATVVAASCLLVLAISGNLAPMMIAMSVLGFALGLSQTTTMDWVVNLVDDTSRGSALGLRVATNRVGQAFILAAAGAISGLWGVEAAFVLLAVVMLATAASGVASARRGAQSAGARAAPGDIGVREIVSIISSPMRVIRCALSRLDGAATAMAAGRPAKSRNATATEPTSSSVSPALTA